MLDSQTSPSKRPFAILDLSCFYVKPTSVLCILDLNGILCINGAHDIDEVAYLVVSLGDSGGKVTPIGKW